jgi:hypothetical protein
MTNISELAHFWFLQRRDPGPHVSLHVFGGHDLRYAAGVLTRWFTVSIEAPLFLMQGLVPYVNDSDVVHVEPLPFG